MILITTREKIMKKILSILIAFTVLGSQFAMANNIYVVAYHKGREGENKLANRQLLLQITSDPNSRMKVTTDANGVFIVDDQYAKFDMRAYLINYDGNIRVGCYSNFIPVTSEKIVLKGVGCL